MPFHFPQNIQNLLINAKYLNHGKVWCDLPHTWKEKGVFNCKTDHACEDFCVTSEIHQANKLRKYITAACMHACSICVDGSNLGCHAYKFKLIEQFVISLPYLHNSIYSVMSVY